MEVIPEDEASGPSSTNNEAPRQIKNEVPVTPDWMMGTLSRELKQVISEKNLLTCRTRKRVLDDMEATAAEAEDAQMEKLRAKAVQEVISSEKSYLRHLEIIEEYFMRPLEDSPSILSRKDFVRVFGDLAPILQVNRELLKCLEESSDRIGKVFTQLAPYLKFYSTYANDFREAVKVVEKQMGKCREFRTLVQNQESRPEVQLKLNSLLITPVQRIPRYKLLLEDVISKTPECHPDKASLDSALEQIDGVAWHINEQLREHENSMKILDIQKSLVGGQPKVIAPGRRLIKQGVLMKVPRTGATSGGGQPRYFVLFSDMVMYCKVKSSNVVLPRHNALDCGCALPLKITSVENVVGRGVFKLKCGKEELLLYSKDGASVSQEWIQAIQETTGKYKASAATLRKESSRRTPLKRPDLMRLRRESLSQIMMIRLTKEKAKKLLLTPKSSSSKKAAPSASANENSSQSFTGASPVLRKRKSSTSMSSTPNKSDAKRARTVSIPQSAPATPTTGEDSRPPARTPQLRAQLRAKNGGGSTSSDNNEPTLRWKTLMRKRVENNQQHKGKVSLFRSPSIFDKDEEAGSGGNDDVMAKYLAGQMGPLTPSLEPTNVAHLVKYKPTAGSNKQSQPKSSSDGSTLSESFSLKTPSRRKMKNNENESSETPREGINNRMTAESFVSATADATANYCLIM